MSSIGYNCVIFHNLGLEWSEGAVTFAFLANASNCVTQDKLVIVLVWVEGEIPMLLYQVLKDGRFIVGLDHFLFELDDQR